MSYTKTCHYCKDWYQAQRSSSRFCSTSCRVQYSKLDSTLSTKAGNSWGGLADILELAKKYPEKTDVALAQIDWIAERLELIRQLVVEYGEKAGNTSKS